MRQPPTTLDFTVNILFTSFNFTSPFMLWLLNPRMRRLTDLTLYQMVRVFYRNRYYFDCPRVLTRSSSVWRVALIISRNREPENIMMIPASILFLLCFQSSCWPKVACCSGGVVHREGVTGSDQTFISNQFFSVKMIPDMRTDTARPLGDWTTQRRPGRRFWTEAGTLKQYCENMIFMRREINEMEEVNTG